MSEYLESIQRLTRDLKNASVTLSEREARFLVDAYYAMQKDRIRSVHQERKLSESAEPNTIMSWLADQRGTLEKEVAKALDVYSASHRAGVWARSIVGIGPIITAGLIAHLRVKEVHKNEDEIEETIIRPTAGHFWRIAGLDPSSKWKEGQKRPWNGSLKRLCWLIGESFTKVSNNDKDVYGKVYRERKELEIQRNDAGLFAEQAAESLSKKNWRADTATRKHYEAGHLPPARIHLRAQRYAVKLFLSHLHHVMYEIEFGVAPPKPYILTQPGHAHYTAPPNWPMAA
jgi:hypothetical protein